MKAILLTSAILFLVSFNSFSQEQFRLSDYKNPDYRWQKLDLGFGLGGTNSYDRNRIEDGAEYKNVYSQFNSGLDAHYYGTKNSASYQGYQRIGLNTDILSDRSFYEDLINEDVSSEQKSNRQYVQLSAETINRFYLKKKWFIETDLELVTEYSHSVINSSLDQDIFPYSYKAKTNQYRIIGNLPVLAGIGRIEEVQDARLAVYILDDLLASGDLTRSASSEEIIAFAEFITGIKNQRYFDYRLRKIAEITAIDSFLAATGLKAQSDASYYTLINDNWDNSSGPVRSTGSRLFAGFVPNLDFSFYGYESFWEDTLNTFSTIINYTNKNDEREFFRGLDFMTGYIWEKPANLYWQHTLNASLSYSLYRGNGEFHFYEKDSLVNSSEAVIDSPNINFNVGYLVGFYPNSRTQVTLGISSEYSQYWGEQETDGENKIDLAKILVQNRVDLRCYYYISPQLRFTLGLTSNYSFTKQNQEQPSDPAGDEFDHSFHNSISASLIYSIF